MKATQFNKALGQLGVTQTALAKLLRINERTVRRFASGESEVPTTVAMLLNLMLDTKTGADGLRA